MCVVAYPAAVVVAVVARSTPVAQYGLDLHGISGQAFQLLTHCAQNGLDLRGIAYPAAVVVAVVARSTPVAQYGLDLHGISGQAFQLLTLGLVSFWLVFSFWLVRSMNQLRTLEYV